MKCAHAAVIAALAFAFFASFAGDEKKTEPHFKKLPLPATEFIVEGHSAFLILPAEPAKGAPIPWVWFAPALPPYPAPEEKWMFEKFTAAGIAIAGIDVGESFGSPAGSALYSALHRELTANRGLAKKPVLLPRSRGGLMLYCWAVENAESVAGIAGIYPVCSFEGYGAFDKAAAAFGLTAAEFKAQLTKHNPIDRLAPLAKARVPIFHIHGDDDKIVPLPTNSAELERRYKELGGPMELVIAKGQDHNMWQGFFQCNELVEFVIKHAKAGAK